MSCFAMLLRIILFAAAILGFSAAVVNSQSDVVNMTHAAKIGNLNLGLVNSSGFPVQLEFTQEGSKAILNAYGTNYNLEDLFTIENLINQADDPSIPDNDYFCFSQENLVDSQHGLFYARWSISAQRSPEYKTLGEDGLFVKEFTGDYNFKCPLEASGCLGLVSRYEVQDMFPQNRPLARLVYFQLMKIALLHDVANGVHDSMRDTHVYILGQIHEIVAQFTRQPDATRAQICALTQEVVKTLTDMAIKTAMSYIPPIAPLQVVVGHQELFKESIGRYFGRKDPSKWRYPFQTGKFKEWWAKGQMGKEMKKHYSFSKQEPKAFDINIDPAGKLYPYLFRFFTQYDHILTTTSHLDQGYSKSVLCGGFEGDEGNRLEGNKNKLMKHLSTYFVELERNIRSQYRVITSGKVIEDDEFPKDNSLPTLQGILGMHMLWTGEGSIQATLFNMDPTRAAISSALERQIISDVIRKDGNWAACTLKSDAQALCQQAKTSREENKNSKAIQGRFCPDRDDPTLVCASGRWYHHKFSSHVVPFAPLKAFSGYTSTYFETTFDDAMSEAYGNYKTRKNNMEIDTQGWTLGHVKGGGMRIAFCVSDHYKLTDFGGYILAHARPGAQWEMPSVCGELGTESSGFLDAVGLGIGSQPYSAKEDFGKPSQLYRDRLPRKFSKLSPYLSYMQYGRTGIQFPLRREVLNLTTSTAAAHAKDLLLASNPSASLEELKVAGRKAAHAIEKDPRWTLMNRWKVFTGVDSDYEMIREMTEGKGKSEVVLNAWFCGKGMGYGLPLANHTVFERERGHIDLSTFPTGRIESHRKRCEVWMRDHAVDVEIVRLEGAK